MRVFANLLQSLLYAPQRLVKQAYLVEFIRNTPDPDRGYALSALTGDLSIKGAKEFNDIYSSNKNVYYFSYPTYATKELKNKNFLYSNQNKNTDFGVQFGLAELWTTWKGFLICLPVTLGLSGLLILRG